LRKQCSETFFTNDDLENFDPNEVDTDALSTEVATEVAKNGYENPRNKRAQRSLIPGLCGMLTINGGLMIPPGIEAGTEGTG